MGLASGLDGQFGMAEEVSYGTYVAPTRFLEFNSESIKPDIGQIMSRGLGRARTQRGSQVRTYVKMAGGDVEYEVMDVGFGLPFKHCLGAVATSGTEDPYIHTFTPDANGLKGKFATVQIGRPDVSGTVQPFSYVGAKVAKWKLECAVDDPLKLTITWDAKTEDTSKALAAKSYGAGAVPLIFVDGSATIGGSAISIKSFSLEGDNGLDLERRFLGNSKKEPLPKDQLLISGSFEYEFEGLTRHAALVAGTLIDDVVLTFTVGSHGLTATVPQMIYLPDGSPSVGGPDIVAEEMPWQAVDNGTDPLITLEYITSDATP